MVHMSSSRVRTCPSPLYCNYYFKTNPDNNNSSLLSKRAWGRGKYKIIDEHLSHIDWDFEFCHLSVHAILTKLLDILTPLIDSYIPFSIQPIPSSSLKPLAALKRERWKAWQFFKTLRRFYGRQSRECSSALNNYNQINHQYRNFFTHSQISYKMSLIDKLQDNPKAFHQYIRSKKVGDPTVGPLMHPGGSLVENCCTMAEMFVNSFSLVFKDS